MTKKYQVFVSSTYADLKEERRRVLEALMELDCIPAGMELFPAADEEQLLFIKRVIDDCDYYLLIIGGRYGSTTAEGISYTEREYDYALERGLSVIALLHENPDEIPLGKSEKEPELRASLQRFRARVELGRLVKYWRSAADLPGQVALSVSSAIRLHPAVGWTRADRAASEDILADIHKLQKQKDVLQQALDALQSELSTPIENLAGLDEKVELRGYCSELKGVGAGPWSVKLTWKEIFSHLSPYLMSNQSEKFMRLQLKNLAFRKSRIYARDRQTLFEEHDFHTVSIQLQALGLIRIEYLKTVQGSMALFWSLTPLGKRQMLELRLVRSTASSGAETVDP